MSGEAGPGGNISVGIRRGSTHYSGEFEVNLETERHSQHILMLSHGQTPSAWDVNAEVLN